MTQNPDFIINIIQALNHPLYVIDADTYIIRMANTATYTGELPEGITCYALTHHRTAPCDRFGEICPLAEIKRGKPGLSVEHFHHDADGHYEALEVHAFPIFGAEGQLIGIIEYTLDITERKETERLKDEFIAMVSHELRTPLHHIKGYATTLLQTDVVWDAATQQDFLGSINREADRLSDLIEKILDLSRLEAGLTPMEREWCQIADLIDGALLLRRGLLATRAIEVDLGPDLPALFVDGQEIELVLTNLIENAAKYSANHTPIRIGALRKGDEVILSVADQGIGIPQEHQGRIFERFYRVPRAGPRLPGTGLGLAICRRIVEAHGGQIWVASKSGSGSCFYVSLPVDGPGS